MDVRSGMRAFRGVFGFVDGGCSAFSRRSEPLVQSIFFSEAMTLDDKDYLRLAAELAERGAGWVSPNPLVGAVLVRDGHIIGQGWHARCGGLHAERAALADCREDPAGAALYVTLEPCCHTGRQPPCTDAILAAGIRRVVVGSLDPNP